MIILIQFQLHFSENQPLIKNHYYFSANNSNIQSNVTGLKKIKESTNGVLQLWKNGDVLTLMCWSDENNVTFSTDWTVYSEGFIPLGYRPKSAMMVTNVARIDTYWKIDADTGNISKRTSANNPASNIKSWAMFTWCI